jgi:hypothetical protein
MGSGMVTSYLDPGLSMTVLAQNGCMCYLSCRSWSPVSPISLWEHSQESAWYYSPYPKFNSVLGSTRPAISKPLVCAHKGQGFSQTCRARVVAEFGSGEGTANLYLKPNGRLWPMMSGLRISSQTGTRHNMTSKWSRPRLCTQGQWVQKPGPPE